MDSTIIKKYRPVFNRKGWDYFASLLEKLSWLKRQK